MKHTPLARAVAIAIRRVPLPWPPMAPPSDVPLAREFRPRWTTVTAANPGKSTTEILS